MHPPKIQTFDVPARVNLDTKGVRREVAEYRRTPFGLYMSRPVVGRASAWWIESWLLPDLGLVVTDWQWNPGHEREQDFYLDVARIEPGEGTWRTTDLYLDLVVKRGHWTEVLDVDEFVEAVAGGLIDTATAEWALHRCHTTVAALAAHGHDLDVWLAEHGVVLTWQGPGEEVRPAG